MDEIVFKRSQLLKERICSWRSKFFPLKVGPNYKGIKTENDTVASPENVLIHLLQSKILLDYIGLKVVDMPLVVVNPILVTLFSSQLSSTEP